MACGCQALIAQGKAEAASAVTHLASLGVKRQERHAGVTKEKKEVVACWQQPFLYHRKVACSECVLAACFIMIFHILGYGYSKRKQIITLYLYLLFLFPDIFEGGEAYGANCRAERRCHGDGGAAGTGTADVPSDGRIFGSGIGRTDRAGTFRGGSEYPGGIRCSGEHWHAGGSRCRGKLSGAAHPYITDR